MRFHTRWCAILLVVVLLLSGCQHTDPPDSSGSSAAESQQGQISSSATAPAVMTTQKEGETTGTKEGPGATTRPNTVTSSEVVKTALSLGDVAAIAAKKPPAVAPRSVPSSNSLPSSTHNKEKVITMKKFDVPENRKSSSKIKLDVVLSNKAVLQAHMPVRIWGTTTLGDVDLAAIVKNTKTGDTRTFYGTASGGEFEIWLGATEYGGPYEITVCSRDGQCQTISDVLFGEVYILGGQSNMGWAIGQCYDGKVSKLLYQKEIDSSANDNLREMLVWPVSSTEPVKKLDSCRQWQGISPSSVVNVSAAGYFFGQKLQEELKVPVGLVSSCMGATSLSTWLPGFAWYNGMISPINKMTVRGVLWYQGEGDPTEYGERLARLIRRWREEFQNPDMLFHVIQLPRYVNAETWYLCREEDKKVCSFVDKCTYSVNIDTGLLPNMIAEGDTLNTVEDPTVAGIHPYQKKEVGIRAADALLEKVYGAKGCWTSPYLTSCTAVEDGSVLLQFDNVAEGLVLRGLAGFEAAGADGKYVDVKPVMVGKTAVSVSWDKKEKIVSVRYGYTNNSSFIQGEITNCAQCVSLYNTVNGKVAYPAEQFTANVAAPK